MSSSTGPSMELLRAYHLESKIRTSVKSGAARADTAWFQLLWLTIPRSTELILFIRRECSLDWAVLVTVVGALAGDTCTCWPGEATSPPTGSPTPTAHGQMGRLGTEVEEDN